MGTPIPDPFEPPPSSSGTRCNACWGVGKPFGEGDTPSSMWISISGVNHGPNWVLGDGDAPEGNYELLQNGIRPCLYDLDVDSDHFNITLSGINSSIGIDRGGVGFIFQNVFAGGCATNYSNIEDNKFTGGTVIVSWSEPE